MGKERKGKRKKKGGKRKQKRKNEELIKKGKANKKLENTLIIQGNFPLVSNLMRI